MRKIIVMFIVTVLLPAASGQAFAGSRPAGNDVDFAYFADDTPGVKASSWLRTNEVVYDLSVAPGNANYRSIEAILDIDPNGHLFSKSMFMYLLNANTGEIRYINVDEGIMEPGQITDYSGNDLANVTAYPIPEVDDFIVFGQGGHVGPGLNPATLGRGVYQLVFELRDATGRNVFQRFNTGFAVVDSVEVMPQSITSDLELTNDKAYVLNNATTFVRQGATLSIEAGVYILGQGQTAALVIDRGAKIEALGSANAPIVFTSANPVGDRAAADWGGLIINGRAQLNVPGGEAEGEGDTGTYGGTDDADSSGTLRYVRVEFGGTEFSPSNELNGIAFQGVGSGTVIEYLQVHQNLDDGVEFFGGNAWAKYIYLTGNADDSLDWTDGWRGKAQFVAIQQYTADADQGIEADNNGENNSLLPRSNPTIYNVTIVGPGSNPIEGDIGFLLREGSAVTLRNAIITGAGEEAFLIDMDSTVAQATAGNIKLTNSIFFGNGTSEGQDNFGLGSSVTTAFDIDGFMSDPEKMNRIEVNPQLRDAFNTTSPDFRPVKEGAATDINYVAVPPADGFFEPVTFVGAFGPSYDWSAGWTTACPE